MDELCHFEALMYKLFFKTLILRIKGKVSFTVSLIVIVDGICFLMVDKRPFFNTKQ